MIGATPQPPADATYGRGLEGLVAGETAISRIDGTKGELSYRGYSVDELAAECSFEEVAYLILYGDLPQRAQLDRFAAQLRLWRRPPQQALDVLGLLPQQAPILSTFRTALAVAAIHAPATGETGPPSRASQETRVPRLLGWTFALAAAAVRHHFDHAPLEPAEDLGLAANFLYQTLGHRPRKEAVRAFEVSLIVQAEHDIHAAALAALSVASAGGSLDGAVLAGVGALGGALHGGANRPAFEMLRRFATPEEARTWVRERIAEKYRFPGYGHRVYKTHDPRGRVLYPFAKALLEQSGERGRRLLAVHDVVRDEIESALGPKGIYANVDAFTGLVYHPIGLPSSAFTLPFCLAIQVGWLAHCLEYLPDGPPLQPRTIYVGP